jgi:copper transport protein
LPLGEGTVELTVDPAHSGRNAMHTYMYDRSGLPTELAPDGLVFELFQPSAGIGPIVREPQRISDGHWSTVVDDLTIPGRWRIDVVARVDRFTEDTATFEVLVAP